jgi:fatty-acyl-CoA synthase
MVVAREDTQAKMDLLAAATLRHTPAQRYTVADRLEEKARAHPTRPFILFEGTTLDYATVNGRANQVAHALRARGITPERVAALLMENRPEFIVTWLALAKLGVTVALINTQLRGEVLRHALATTDAQAVLVGSELLSALASIPQGARPALPTYVVADPQAPAVAPPAAADVVALDRLAAAMPASDLDVSVRAHLRGGDDLFHIFTSGTTGLPKAARLSHMRYLGVGDGMSAIAGYGPDDVIACVLPLYHGAGGMVVVSCALAQGAAIALRRRFSTRRFWDEARRDSVTACQYVGELCRYLLNAPPSPDDRDHRIRVMMGAGLGADIWEAFQARFGIARILEGWSSTEANTSLINLDGRVGSCGRIPFKERHNGRLIRYDVATDEHPRTAEGRCIECAPGEVGEFIGMILELPDSGAGRFEGYTSPEATERKILRDVFVAGDRWYRSGDLLTHDADGYFTFVDRIGDTYRWKSENVSTQEVAETLGAFPGIAIANVYGVAVAGAEGRAGMAALVLRPGRTFDTAAFYAFTTERLPPYAQPLFVRLTAEADVTSTFKLRKVELQAEGYDPTRVGDPLFVRDDARARYVPLTPERHAGLATLLGIAATPAARRTS